MILPIFIHLSGAVIGFTMTASLQHSDALPSIFSENTILSETPMRTSREAITHVNKELIATACSSRQSSNANTGSKDPPNSPTSASNFYMCCQSNPNSTTIDHYYPPYACIFGPNTGLCPQGVNSSFIFPWLCTADGGWGVGQIVRGPTSCSVE